MAFLSFLLMYLNIADTVNTMDKVIPKPQFVLFKYRILYGVCKVPVPNALQ